MKDRPTGKRLVTDPLIEEITDYVVSFNAFSSEAMNTARLSLFDSLGCAILSLKFTDCRQRLGPFFPGTEVKNGCRVPGTSYLLDPIQGAFNLGAEIRWLDFNDTWLGREWAHPSDNFAALLAVGDWLGQSGKNLSMKSLLEYAIKAYEIQGVLALSNAYNRLGFDHVAWVKVASTATVCSLLGGTREQIASALSHAFCDVGPLRTYRHAPNTGPRKSWAAAEASAKAVFLAEMAKRGEPPIPFALSSPKWGLNDVLFKSSPLHLTRPLGCFVMEHILFKTAFPAEFHAQTAVEAAFQLYPLVRGRWGEIERIDIETHESALRIIDKKGPLNNPADRDHCLQYMVACALIFGDLKADYYEIETASDPRIDALRTLMSVHENPQFSVDYLDPEKRSIASSLKIIFKGGKSSDKITVEYPLGHKMRRQECLPLLEKKLEENLRSLPELAPEVPDILKLFHDPKRLEAMEVSEFMSHFIPRSF